MMINVCADKECVRGPVPHLQILHSMLVCQDEDCIWKAEYEHYNHVEDGPIYGILGLVEWCPEPV